MKSNKLYSLIAKFYDSIILGLLGHKKAAEYYVKQLPYKRGESIKVLDAGSGTGLYTFAILKRFPNAKIIAFDLNHEMLKVMRSKVKEKKLLNSVRLFRADIISPLPEVNEKFDLIITGGILEHVDIDKAVKNLSKYVKINGYFLNAGVEDSIKGKIVGIFWGFKPLPGDRVIEVFINSGFKLIKHLKLPKKYFIIGLVKRFYLFKKQMN